MKVTKFRCAVLLLLIASIIYGVSYVSAAGSYYSETGELPDDPVLGKIFVAPKPFGATSQGRQFFVVGLGFFVLWCLAIYPPNLWKRKPELTTLEACNRLALSEGQKENEMRKRRDEK